MFARWVVALAVLEVWGITRAAVTVVDQIEPRSGSLNGETRITISGRNFARTHFNFGAGFGHLGNKIELVSSRASYECRFHPDGTHESQITCYTPRIPEDEYTVRVAVDGLDVPAENHCAGHADRCVFKPSGSHTPTLESLVPFTGLPGQMVTFRGKLITNRYGSNVAASSNGKSEKLLRVYLGSHNCEVKNLDDDTLFGIDLDNGGSSVYGNLKCKHESDYVSSVNASFIIEGGYGRSQPSLDILRVSSQNKIYMFQTYAAITDISPKTGSTSGGTRLTITGKHFDETDRPVKVKVADTDCRVVEKVTDTQIICETAPDPTPIGTQIGNRGLVLEIWNETSTDLSNINSLSTSASDYNKQWIDVSHYTDSGMDNYVDRMSGFFVAPVTSEYRFYIQGDDSAELYASTDADPANKVKMCETAVYDTYFKSSSQQSSKVNLTQGQSYYVEILHKEARSSAHVKVAARAYSTEFTKSMTGMAWQEKQKVKFRSVLVREELNIILTTTQTKTETKPVQEVSATGNTYEKFQLGIMGVFTAPMLISTSATDMEKALNQLPIISPDTVTVTTTPQGSGNLYNIVFNTKRGDIPEMTYKLVTPNVTDLIIAISVKTPGVPDLGSFSVNMAGIPSPGISTTASADDVKSAIKAMFQSRCPDYLGDPSDNKYFENYESSVHRNFGERRSDLEAFCGQYASKNPRYLYDKGGDDNLGVSLSQHGTFCFAYLGRVNKLTIRFSYEDDEREKQSTSTNIYIDEPEDTTVWTYECVDMNGAARTKQPSGSDHRVDRIDMHRYSSSQNLYVDVATIVRKPTTDDTTDIFNRRLLPARPNGAIVKDVEVTDNGDGQYTVKLIPHNCGYDFPLMGVEYGKMSAGSLDNSSTSVTYSVTNGGSSLGVEIQRANFASPSIGGTFKAIYQGEETEAVPPTATEGELRDQLQALSTLGSMKVERDGDCANFDYEIEWLDRPGNQEKIQIDASGLTGSTVSIEVETLTDGSLWYDPIVGDMLRTHHTTPQVQVEINGIPSQCQSDCSFTWDSGVTPTISGVNPSSGTEVQNTQITITGTGFSTDVNNTVVKIADVACNVTDSSETSVVCDVGNGPTGAHDIKVYVLGKGLATGSVKFSYTSDISGISPSTGSTEGGTMVTITGYGFTSDGNTTIDDVPCLKTTVTPGEILCLTPPSASTSDSTATVKVTQEGAVLTSPTSFSYASSLTPVINSVTSTSSSLDGGESVSIYGSGFGASTDISNPLTLGGVSVPISLYTDTMIVFTFPSHSPGSYPLLLQVEEGYANLRTNSIPDIVYSLKVKNVFPTKGSVYGGTKVIITGEGFVDNSTVMEVKFGAHLCVPEHINSTSIVCTIASTGKTHKVQNTGTHTYYGYGYAWNPDSLVVEVGDTVEWSWTTPKFVPNIGYRIEELANASTTIPKEAGFNNGPTKTRDGAYQYTFGKPGTYFYWSGYVDEYDIISLKGKVTVLPKASHTQVLKLTLAGHEAAYELGGSDPSSSEACPGTSTGITGCSDAEPADEDAAKFNFKFYTCNSPVVTNLTLTQGTSDDEIVIEGTGFSTTDCENEIKIGDAVSLVQSSSANAVTFKIDPSTSPAVGVPQELSFRVNNRGHGVVALTGEMSRRFVLLPVVNDVTPNQGSTAGGTTLTLTGSGFQGTASDMSVTLDGYDCEIQSVNYTQIVCDTPSSPAGEVLISTTVSVGGNSLRASCSACNFTYSTDISPTVTDVTPTTVSTSSTMLNFTGTLFGTNVNDLVVTIGGASCVVSEITDINFICDVGDVPVGTHTVDVRVKDKGKAITSSTVESQAIVNSINPNTGSEYGEVEVEMNGNGFVPGSTSVTIGGANCTITSVTATNITCIAPTGSGAADAIVSVGSTTYPSVTFTYASSRTPSITAINPANGIGGDSITITRDVKSSSSAEDTTVSIGGVDCNVTATSASTITCTIGDKPTGTYPVKVVVSGYGASAQDSTFTYRMSASGVTPSTGGIAGGQTLTVTGSGFVTGGTSATVCGEDCPAATDAAQSATQFMCITPARLSVSSTEQCDVVVTVNALDETLSNVYTYDVSVTAEVTDVSPGRGGTAGGTTLTITGTGFGTNTANVDVSVGGSPCNVTTATGTEITCIAGASKSQKTKVVVEVNGMGMAKQTKADFEYIDVWSSRYTWGGENPPTKGDLVVVPKGQILVLDTDTPVLKMLLIQGGELRFDEKDVELQAENILITDGGKLQIGTEEEPFQHKGIITMHGNFRSPELPIYGTKTLAVREGILDLHGRITPVSWTRLESTASAGSTTIVLQHPVNWNVNDEIVIATTGHRHSQKQNEVRKIANIQSDNVTLTLDSPLTYEHLGIMRTISGFDVDFRAEVGLLTHNVVVRGARDVQWDDQIEACEAGFDTGEFATQTCFQGRFGSEMGSDEFGSSIMIHAPEKDKDLAIARISHVEVTHAGQAFRLGRYPIHFHLNGDMSSSYVRGCSIHHAFNRAVNIHGTHNTFVEFNVLYDVKGGAFFLEDGIETGNFIRYNLGVFVRASTSLLNDDITPATFWVTNPNNTISHNAAAGGSHFGFWYRMHTHPEGPSFTKNVCCKHVPLGEFKNNTAHSFGWFGLWIFEDYFPKVDGSCSSSAPDLAAKFETLTAWNCEKGAEAVNSGSLQFIDFILVNNEKAGYEGKLLVPVPQFDEVNGPMIKGGLISGYHDDVGTGCTHGGIVLPYQNGLLIKNVTFVNFDKQSCAAFTFTRIAGTCSDLCGGFLYKSSGLTFENSANKVKYVWEYEGVIEDTDGTLTTIVGGSVIPTTPSLPPSCNVESDFSFGINGSVCPADVRFHRFAFNGVKPKSLEAKNISITNQYGSSIGEFRLKRITHKPGWMVLLVDGEDYTMQFVNAEHLTNVSFDGIFYHFYSSDQYITVAQQAERPDRFRIGGQVVNETIGFNPASATSGSWMYDETNGRIKYLLSGNTGSRKKRGAITYDSDRKMKLEAFRCYYRNCIVPPEPSTVFASPEHALPWSLNSSWEFRVGGKPGANENVTIDRDYWILADEEIPPIETLIIYGGLEFTNNASMTFDLHAKFIIVYGRLVIGWEHDPFPGLANIYLYGSHDSPIHPVFDGPTLGSKFLAVYGGVDMFGLDPGVTWTSLETTANTGDTSITLIEPVDWPVDSEILITTTSFNAWATETFKISSISVDKKTLTLNASLAFPHVAVSESLPTGHNYSLSAKVAILSRNIKIIGADYDKLYDQSYGSRIIVARTAEGSKSYSGFAKIQNVEFYHSGQEGYTESYDPRFSVSFIDVTNSGIRSSFLRKNTFHNGFSRAIGVFGISDLAVEDNVIHHTVGPGIVTNSENTTLIRNLVTLSIWPGSYQDRNEEFNIENDGGIHAIDATNLILIDNVVAGSERLGYRTKGEECTGVSNWRGNEAHSCLTGVGIFPADPTVSQTCVRFANFIAWKNMDFGFYYNNGPSFEGENLVSLDNKVGVFPMVVGPSTVGHQTSDKYVKVKDSLMVGKTSAYDCTTDVVDGTDQNIINSGQARSWGNGTHGSVGISWPSFTAGSNNAPEKPFKNIMSYQAISGVMFITNVTFANYGTSCTSSHDYAITTNPSNDDGQHPIESDSLTFHNVDSDNKVFIHKPNLGVINPSDCVDMDCDGLKKAMIKDLDGTLTGSPGAVLPLSEFEWNGDPRRGLGDYRVPKVMQTAFDGTRLDLSTVAPNLGIYRNPECIYHDNWRAYECHELDYEMLIIENMDADTETRRISPVAILGEGYLDLINGPQDHGWCSGYTCRKRVSTFQAIVATNKTFDIYYTSTTPQKMRYHLLNSNADQRVRLGVWYARPNRLDVYVNDVYVMPKNGVMKNGKFVLRTDMTPTQFMPDVTSDVIGTNYVSREEKMIFFVVTGEDYVEVRTAAVVIVSYTLPAMTVDEFFGENLVSNIAAFLNVDPRKVRIVNVVNEQSVGRKKRSTTGTKVEVEIGNEPDDSSPMSYSEIQNVETSISNGVALGTMDVLPNGTVALSVGMTPAAPPVGSDEWEQSSNDDVEPVVLNKAGNMAPHEVPVPGREGRVFDTPIRLRVYDENSDPLSIVGSQSSPWQLEATLNLGAGSHANATLQGTTTVSFSGGWANFTDLIITLPGSDYSITFTVTAPSEAANFTATVSSLTVLSKLLTATMVSTTSDPLEGAPISLTLELQDAETGSALSDIAWRGHTWDVIASMSSNEELGGSLNQTFNPATGRVYYTDLVVSEIGKYYLTFIVTSSPPEYSFTIETYVDVTTEALRNLVVEKSSTCQFKFDVTYDPVQSPKDATEFANAWAIKNKDKGVRVTGSSAAPGSVIVTITFEGEADNVTEMIGDLCSQVQDGSTTYTFGGNSVAMSPYMMVDGNSYYGSGCGGKASPYMLHPGILAAIIILSVTVVILLVLIVIWKVKVVPKTKTTTSFESHNHMKYLGHVDSPWQAEDFICRDDSFFHNRTHMTPPIAPAATLHAHAQLDPHTAAINTVNRYDLYIDTPRALKLGNKMPLPAD